MRQHPPLTEAWEKRYRSALERVAEGRLPDPISVCGTPAGYPRLLALPDVYEFIVRPEQTWIITENGPNIMRIYTDGRAHAPAEERWPTFTGDSVGDWDGETLRFSTGGTRHGNGHVRADPEPAGQHTDDHVCYRRWPASSRTGDHGPRGAD